MQAVISVSLPNEMAVRLNELVDASGRAKSEIVKEALRRYLWEERFDALRLRLGKKARTRGLVTDEDVVSGDKDLLVLDYCRGVKIITPRTFELLFKD